jgi:hypothetical protein
VTLRWAIGGATDGEACARERADSVEVDVLDADEARVAQVEPPCSAFGTALVLREGSYRLVLTLLDANNRTVSLAQMKDVVVAAGENVAVRADFPARAE